MDKCDICGSELDVADTVHCNNCGRKFHLSHDEGEEPCGAFRFRPLSCALIFVCSICASELPAPASE